MYSCISISVSFCCGPPAVQAFLLLNIYFSASCTFHCFCSMKCLILCSRLSKSVLWQWFEGSWRDKRMVILVLRVISFWECNSKCIHHVLENLCCIRLALIHEYWSFQCKREFWWCGMGLGSDRGLVISVQDLLWLQRWVRLMKVSGPI